MKKLIINNGKVIIEVPADIHHYRREIIKFLGDCPDYPKISQWLDKVFSEVENNIPTREIILAVDSFDGSIIGISILKKNNIEKKICTFLIREDKRSQGYGTALMKRSQELLSEKYPIISVPLCKLNDMTSFLRKYNFRLSKFSVIDGVPDKIEAFYNTGDSTNILISIKTVYANEIFSGNKKVEFRKRFCSNFDSAIVYSSGVDRKLIGFFTPERIEVLEPNEIWNRYGRCGCISEDKFKEYYNSSTRGTAIVIKNFYKFPEKLSPEILFNGRFTPPQSYTYL